MSHDPSPDQILQIMGLSKSFPGNRALDRFSLSIAPGEVHALIGANGSGKSTLIKILSGFHQPDPGGTVTVGGENLTFGSPERSYRLGCRFVHQDLGLILNLSVADNIHMGKFPSRLYTVRSGPSQRAAQTVLQSVGLTLDPRAPVSSLGAAQRTGVALARAVRPDAAYPPRLLVLDEPTARLPADEVDHLISMIKQAAANQIAILFVSHHMEEVHRIADSVTVLRDGVVAGRFGIGEVDPHKLIELVAGEPIGEVSRQEPGQAEAAAASLAVTDLWAGPLRGVSFSASKGEVLGIAGITGSGREFVLPAIFGVVKPPRGVVWAAGTTVSPGRPDRSMAAGMGFLPAERKVNGGVMELSARENLTLADLRPFWSRGLLSRRRENAETRRWLEALDVRPRGSGEQVLLRFSGGNQQKILFAKWMRLQPAVLLLDEPSQGVDVSAKLEIHRQILAAAAAGMTVVVASTDNEELTTVCSRVLVVRNGLVTAELSGPQVTASQIARAMAGLTPTASSQTPPASPQTPEASSQTPEASSQEDSCPHDAQS